LTVINDSRPRAVKLRIAERLAAGMLLLSSVGSRGRPRLIVKEGRPMIKDVMVRLDGTDADETRLAAAEYISEVFDAHIIGIFLNVLPLIVPAEGDRVAATESVKSVQHAREAGDRIEAVLIQRLSRLQKPVDIRRIDVFSDTLADIAAREARQADTFVALRPNGAPQEPEYMIEGVLFGSGRHLFLVPDRKPAKMGFDHILVAWNNSRESTRALAEAMPYLHKAKTVAVVSVVDEDEVEEDATIGIEAVNHLKHHGIETTLHHPKKRKGDIGAALIAEARRQKADLIVMGGYGHSRLREWLLGGVTYELLHQAPVALLMAH
jgi:nucleotide-binding universal stress UspA family protein